MATTALYRKNGGECIKISTIGQPFADRNTDYWGILTDPLTPDGTEASENNNAVLRVFGYSKIALPGTNTVRNATQGEIDTFAGKEGEDKALMDKGRAVQLFETHPQFRKLMIAFADVIKNEINLVRGWTVDFKAEVAAASNLGDLKTRVAVMATLDDRTLSQLKTTITNRVSEND